MPRQKVGPRPVAGAASERRRVTKELRTLAHPLRLRLLEAFAQGPRTTMQVATQLGEPPTRLYHHVNALERAGILELRSTRQVRGTTEKYYAIAKRRVGATSTAHLGGLQRAPLRGLATLVLDQARTELLCALADPKQLTLRTAPMALRMLINLPPSKLPAVRRRIAALLRSIKQECKATSKARAGSTAQWAFTLTLAPTVTGET